jgi:prepilin signal peptidase PulO-like enzyme (type II secretory pathway)
MLLVCIAAGLAIGSFINGSADYLPRFASSAPVSIRPTRYSLALWQWLKWLASRRGLRFLVANWPSIAVELGTVLLLVYLWQRYGLSLKFFYLAVTCSFFLLIALVDLRYRLVLNVLIYPTGALVLLSHAMPPGREMLLALVGGAFGLLPFLLAILLKPGGIGAGDVRLATLVGLVVGFPQVVYALLVAVLMGGIMAAVLLLTRRWTLTSHIPYAPFLCLGAISILVYVPFYR